MRVFIRSPVDDDQHDPHDHDQFDQFDPFRSINHDEDEVTFLGAPRKVIRSAE